MLQRATVGWHPRLFGFGRCAAGCAGIFSRCTTATAKPDRDFTPAGSIPRVILESNSRMEPRAPVTRSRDCGTTLSSLAEGRGAERAPLTRPAATLSPSDGERGENSTERRISRFEPLQPQDAQVFDFQGDDLEVHGESGRPERAPLTRPAATLSPSDGERGGLQLRPNRQHAMTP